MKKKRLEFLDWCAISVLVLCVAVCVRFTLCDSSPTKPDAVQTQGQVTQDKTVSHDDFFYVVDFDSDGYIAAVSWKEACSHAPSDELKELCEVGTKTSLKGVGDCDDQSASVHPGAPEIVDGKDNDCDGETDETHPCDVDSDCVPPPGFLSIDRMYWSGWTDGRYTYGCLSTLDPPLPFYGVCGKCEDDDQDGICAEAETICDDGIDGDVDCCIDYADDDCNDPLPGTAPFRSSFPHPL